MSKFFYYENRTNNSIEVHRKTPVLFSHIWRVYNLESLRYFERTNVELPNYASLYTHVCKFVNSLQNYYEVENWIIKAKKEQFYKKKTFSKLNYKKLRLFKNFTLKISKSNTKTVYKILAFQKQISFYNTPLGISKKFNINKDLIFENLSYKKNFKLQIDNEKIGIHKRTSFFYT